MTLYSLIGRFLRRHSTAYASSGAMLAVAAGCAADWQERLGLPRDVVRGVVSIGGRYGLWMANAIISGRDLDHPPHDWRLPAAPDAVVVFGEEERDMDGSDDAHRARDCAIIGRTLISALQAKGSNVREVALPPCGHNDTVRSMGVTGSKTAEAVGELAGIE